MLTCGAVDECDVVCMNYKHLKSVVYASNVCSADLSLSICVC